MPVARVVPTLAYPKPPVLLAPAVFPLPTPRFPPSQRVGATRVRRVWECEDSSSDAALLLQAVVLAREYLRHPGVTALVDQRYARIDWRWARNGGDPLSHGWRPEQGFIAQRWDSYP